MKTRLNILFSASAGMLALAATHAHAQDACSAYPTGTAEQIDYTEIETKLGALPAPARPLHFAYVTKTLINEFWQDVAVGIKDEATKHNITVDLLAAKDESSLIEQLNLAQTVLSGKPDALVLSPQPDSNLAPVIEAARKLNIPTVIIDDARTAGASTYVGTDQIAIGVKAADFLGSVVRFICRLGNDDFAIPAKRRLASYGVDLSLVGHDETGATGIAIINVGEGGENYISLIGGSNLGMDETDVARGRAALEAADVLLLQLEVPLAAGLAAAAIVRAHGGLVILDPAPAPKDGLSSGVLKSVDIITPNETEAGRILGWQPQSLDEGLRAAIELRARGVATAIVKLGARGLAVASDGVEAFLAAGYSDQHVFGVVLAIACKTFSNFANHIAGTPVDAVFSAYAID